MGRIDTIYARHSVRAYTDRQIEGETLEALQAAVDDAARRGDLDIQLVLDNPEVYNLVAKFGVIHGATSSIIFVAEGRRDDEAIGYWGQGIVLAAQELGLNTCWAAMFARKKTKAQVPAGKSPRISIAVGYGATQGKPRRCKPAPQLVQVDCADEPAWFAEAVDAALLAPTAMNKQDFRIQLCEDARTVRITAPGTGLTTIDLGIVKRNFEEAASELGADFELA